MLFLCCVQWLLRFCITNPRLLWKQYFLLHSFCFIWCKKATENPSVLQNIDLNPYFESNYLCLMCCYHQDVSCKELECLQSTCPPFGKFFQRFITCLFPVYSNHQICGVTCPHSFINCWFHSTECTGLLLIWLSKRLQSAPNAHVHQCAFALRPPQSCLRLGRLVVITVIDLSSCSHVGGYQMRCPITMQIKVSWEDGYKSSFIASVCRNRGKRPHRNPIISLIVSSSKSVLGEGTGRV